MANTVKKKAVHTVRIALRDEDGEILRESDGKARFKDIKPGTVFDCWKTDVDGLTESGAITGPGKVTQAEIAQDAADKVDDDQASAQQTREALEDRATELKIKFNKNWGDDTLRTKIAEAIKAQGDDGSDPDDVM